MKFDRNTVIGFSLLAVLFFGYFYVTSTQQKDLTLYKKHVQDSLDKIVASKKNVDTVVSVKENNIKTLSPSTAEIKIVEKFYDLENDLLKIKFTNKGAKFYNLILKKHKSYNENKVILIAHNSFDFNYIIKYANATENIDKLFFQTANVKTLDDHSQVLEFVLTNSNQDYLKHIYTLRPDSYLIDFKIETNNILSFFSAPEIPITWTTNLLPHESNVEYERTQSQLSIMTTEDNFDYFSLGNEINEQVEEPLKWISIKQQFFNNTLISKSPLKSVNNHTVSIKDSTSKFFVNSQTTFKVNFAKDSNTLAFQLFYGPTDYKTLQLYGLEKIMNIGQGFYAFVKYVNKFLVMPIFDFLSSLISNYGIVILLLTIFLRIITAPLLYTSYTSSAKMKILKPDLDALKKKMGSDQQGYAMKQMELFKQAGVNPLGGCIPALLQIPIFLSLFYFFNSCIDLRGESFLWAKDLSSYDSIYTFSFEIPFYGNHISLFTLLNVITTFFTSYMSMRNTPDQGNPMLKYMPYIFPIILLGFFNKLPSALTWYYTVSNLITLILQYVIQNFIINHDKLMAQIEIKRKQPQKKSSWMQKMEQVQTSQKKLQDLKERAKQNKK